MEHHQDATVVVETVHGIAERANNKMAAKCVIVLYLWSRS
jgi:hypothetical protein